MSLDESIRSLAASQHSILTRVQLEDLGLTRSGLRHRLTKGTLQRIASNLFCIGGVAVTADLRLRAGLAECGGRSAIAQDTAAAYWQFPGFQLDPIHVLRLRDGTYPPTRFARLHTTTTLTDTQVVEKDGLFITTPARTLFDLARRVHPGRLERLLDRAWSRRLVNWQIMQRTFRELQGRGRAGTVVMRELLEARPVDYVPPASNLEARFRDVLREDAQPELDRQVNVGNNVAWLGRVDFIDRAKKVIVEVQSDLHHTSISDCQSDAERKDAMTKAGWKFVEVREFDLWHRPAKVQRAIKLARTCS